MSLFRKYFGTFLTLLLLLVGGVGVGMSYQKTAQQTEVLESLKNSGNFPVAAFDHMEYDWGEVSRTEVVETTFLLSNTGTADLEISKMMTSCGCTTAELQISGEVQVLPAALSPGEEATLVVRFDPDVMDARGDIKRAVRIETNDPTNPFFVLNLTAHVE